jgi:hypothetical protein
LVGLHLCHGEPWKMETLSRLASRLSQRRSRGV